MFGYPAYYIDEKIFGCLYEDGVGLKVPERKAIELLGSDDTAHFRPLGRKKMKEWVQINRGRYEDYIKDRDIFQLSINYVSSMKKSR